MRRRRLIDVYTGDKKEVVRATYRKRRDNI